MPQRADAPKGPRRRDSRAADSPYRAVARTGFSEAPGEGSLRQRGRESRRRCAKAGARCVHVPVALAAASAQSQQRQQRAADGLPTVPRRDQGPDRGCADSCRARRQQRADPAPLGDRPRDPRSRAPRGVGRQGHQSPGRRLATGAPGCDGLLAVKPALHAELRRRLAPRGGQQRSCPTGCGTTSVGPHPLPARQARRLRITPPVRGTGDR